MSESLRFEDVHRHFAGTPVLQGLSFSVAPGEVFALLGRNGTGKTTALSILTGFLRPHAGRSFVLGEPSESVSPATRERVGLVTEGHPLYRWMSVKGAVDFEAGTRRRFDRAYVESMLARLELPSRRRIGRLSRGMRAQLSLVFALACDPELLILDDPAMGLDAVVRREFLDAMIELVGKRGRSVLFSSHILPDVERIADRVGILRDGRLVVDAGVDELKRRVARRFARASDDPAALRALPGVLSARQLRDGVLVTTVDLDEAREAHLRERTTFLGEPEPLTLEELFVELTTRPSDAALARAGGAA